MLRLGALSQCCTRWGMHSWCSTAHFLSSSCSRAGQHRLACPKIRDLPAEVPSAVCAEAAHSLVGVRVHSLVGVLVHSLVGVLVHSLVGVRVHPLVRVLAHSHVGVLVHCGVHQGGVVAHHQHLVGWDGEALNLKLLEGDTRHCACCGPPPVARERPSGQQPQYGGMPVSLGPLPIGSWHSCQHQRRLASKCTWPSSACM